MRSGFLVVRNLLAEWRVFSWPQIVPLGLMRENHRWVQEAQEINVNDVGAAAPSDEDKAALGESFIASSRNVGTDCGGR